MKITEVRLWMLRVPLRTPFRTALRVVEQIEDIVISVHTNGDAIGYGEAPPTAAITGETHTSIVEAIGRIAPYLIGESVDDAVHLGGLIQGAVANNSSAKAAVEIAVYDLFAQRQALPLYRVLGGEQPLLTTDITISIDAIDKMVADSLDAVRRGFTALKIKVGKQIDEDIERVKAIHAALRGRAVLRLDANQGWTAQQAVTAMHALEQAGIVPDLLEQPVPAQDLEGLQFVTEQITSPVMADESVFDVAQALEVIRRRAADILSIKLMKCGGIANALRIADLAAEHGIECMMSCMLESSISVAAATHVAAARRHVITRIDLDGPSLCTFNPVDGGVVFDDAQIFIPDVPGLGIRTVRGLEPIAMSRRK